VHLIDYHNARALGEQPQLLGVRVGLAVVARIRNDQQGFVSSADFVEVCFVRFSSTWP